MAIYSLCLNTTVTTNAAPAMDCLAAAANVPRVMEVGLNLGAATASTYGLIRSSNSPAQTSGVALQAENPGDPAALSKMAVAWGTAPTIGSNHLRRVSLPGTIGAGIIWTFPRGCAIAVNTSLVIWNLAANSASTNAWYVADE